jgi:3' terminal RNA ribose 2'-O-methyltransferase Hen1
MLLISTTHKPATDLGYLLRKNPARMHEAELTFGKAYVVYPEATDDRCSAAVLVDIDPVKLVRGSGDGGGSLSQYVNDRPYVASSFLSVAIADLFGTALGGRSKDRPELAQTPLPLEIRIPVLPCRSAEERIARLFTPLGYEVEAKRLELDDQFPEWGPSNYYDVTLKGTLTLRDALRHLYILLPVLDARKHYYMDRNEVTKIVSKGEGWLADHPEKDWILRSSLGRKPSLMREALEQLSNAEEALEAEEASVDDAFVAPEETERKESLHTQRHNRIVQLIQELKPKSLIDLGCGDGKLIRKLIPVRGLDRIVGMDVSYYEIEKAERKLRLDEAGPKMRERLQFIHGSLMYRDERLAGFDVATVVEVVEHLDPPRLAAFERVVFECARPKTVILTTPNREYNALYFDDEGFRHSDHRFEWNRPEFNDWVKRVAVQHGYSFKTEGIGEEHPDYGHPSQMAVFTR